MRQVRKIKKLRSVSGKTSLHVDRTRQSYERLYSLLHSLAVISSIRLLTRSSVQWWDLEREVKKATRDMNQLLNGIESPMSKLDVVQKKYSELLADMRRLDRDHVKSKKRADQLQKEKDQSRSELSKTISMKEKLEKLCRELTRENKKMKVGLKKRLL